MKRLIVCALAAGMAMTSMTAEAKLKAGDAAPALKVGTWVQGDAVTALETGKVYLVEFWATWCPPCRRSIPHLNDLHKKHGPKGLVVIGQNCWERDEAKVAPFVKEQGEKMTYRVALDDRSSSKTGAMAETWMEAAEADGIPTAFLIGKNGKIAWIGHPMDDGLEKKIEAELAK